MILENSDYRKLVQSIANATRLAVLDLRKHANENFYCFSLNMIEEGFAPMFSAWSYEALEREAERYKKRDIDESIISIKEGIKWSYADSPYWLYGEHYFEPVTELLDKRVDIDSTTYDGEWCKEINLRLNAMEEALKILDNEGLFGVGNERIKVVILAEIIPSDYSNTKRAMRLNPKEAIVDWLIEEAEEEEENY